MGYPILWINELEMINQTLFCNVYLKDYLIGIDILTGKAISYSKHNYKYLFFF